jgi:hypothetical protein
MTRRSLAATLMLVLAGVSLATSQPPVANGAYSLGQSTTDVAIPDDGYNGQLTSMASSVVNVLAPAGHHVFDISLTVAIQHAWVGDLTIKLKSPSSTVLTILDRPKGDGTQNPGGDNGADADTDSSDLTEAFPITFNDLYVNHAENMGTAIADNETVCDQDSICTFRPSPDEALSEAGFGAAFDDEAVSGDWTLYVGDSDTDSVASTTGYLSGWSISIQHRRPLDDCLIAPFPDVPINHPFCREIQWMRDEGISTGFGDGTFRPLSNVTRQAMSAFLYRVASNGVPPANCSEPPFSDVPVDHQFCREIQWMKQAEISTGFEDGTYRPASNVTRQAMSAFIVRTGSGTTTPCTEAPFTDVPTSHFFCPDITWMKAAAVSTGFGDGTYRPASPVTRQAMAAFIYRLSLILP